MNRKGIQRIIRLEADAAGNPPTSIHLMSTGQWNAPWHGNFDMNPEDLAEMVGHFNDGVATVEGSKKLPVNYGHDISGKAAGWITSLYTANDGNELWGNVEWTPEGVRMLRDGEFKYISPEWNPRSFPYQDPEDEDNWMNNVFTGAGLTNIPLFKKLKPIMASIVTGSDKPNQPKGGDMDLEKVRVKKPEELSDEEKTFLADHKADLTDDERTAFGLVDAASGDNNNDDTDGGDDTTGDDGKGEVQDGKGQQASAGTVSITASELAQLKAAAAQGVAASQELLKTRMTASVETAIKRGAIKSGEQDNAINLLMASSENQRTQLLAFIAGLPDNSLLANETGDGGSTESSAQAELDAAAQKIVADSKGQTTYVDALQTVMASNSDLAGRVAAERKGKI